MAFSGRNSLLNAKTICLLLCVAWAYAFWPTIYQAGLSYVRSGYDYQGILVLPALFILIMLKNKSLKRANINYSPLGLFLLFLCAMLWLAATLVELVVLQQTAIIAMLCAIVWMNFGRKITAILFLPLSCLFLLLPVGEQVHNAVQHGFAWLLTQALTISGQGVFWDANQFVVDNNAYDIHAYLSSMRHILVFAACGAVYAVFRTKTVLTALTIQLSFVLMPLIMLLICIYSYIILNLFFSNELLVINKMATCGWVLTMLGIFHAMILGYVMRDRKDVITRKDNIDWRDMQLRRHAMLQPLVMGVCILLCVPLLADRIMQSDNFNAKILFNVPNKITGWNTQAMTTKAQSMQAKFKKSQDTVNLSITHDAEPLTASWKKLKQSSKTIKLSALDIPVHETILHNDKNKYKIQWQVNYVNGHYTNNKTVAKALMHAYNLASNGAKSGVISISTDADTELNFARDRLKNFMQDFTSSTQKLG